MNNLGFRSVSRPIALVATTGLIGVVLGCVVVNGDHCANGGPTCADGMVCSKCEVANNGCVAEVIDPLCLLGGESTGPNPESSTSESPTSTGMVDPSTTMAPTTLTETTNAATETTSGTTTSVDPSTTSTTSDPDTTSASTGPECDPNEGNLGCGGMEPYCVDGECVSCSELDCEQIDPDKTTCNVNTGLCVECVDNADCKDEAAPYCDVNMATCQPCTQHEHCGGTACNLDDGTCFPPENVLYVNNTPQLCSDNNPGTDPAEPICNLSEALAKGIVVSGDPTTIKVKRGSTAQSQTATVPPGATVAIVRDGDIPPLLIRNAAEPALDVTVGSRVYVHHITAFNQMQNQTVNMIKCMDATLWLDQVTVYQARTGIMATDCLLHVRRSVVFENFNGGIEVTSSLSMSHVWLENSYITNNGEIFGLKLQKNTFADVLYSTFVGNSSMVAPINCVAGPQNALTVRNSLLAHTSMNFFTGCQFAEPEDGNLKVVAATPMDLINMGIAETYSNGIVKAKKDGLLKNVAHWKMGDPVEDYDGELLRPAGDDMMDGDYAGADVPK